MDWPLFDLRLSLGAVTLEAVRDDDIPRLAELFPDDDEQDPAAERFAWLGVARDRRRLMMQEFWRARGLWSPGRWALVLTVRLDGEIVGLQALEGERFALLRTVDSGSWLAPDVRGRGVGIAMRRCVLALAFDHLGAVAAISSARTDNPASLGVSRHLGYVDNGVSLTDTPTGVTPLQHVRLTRERWLADGSGAGVRAEGVAACLPWFGAGPVATGPVATGPIATGPGGPASGDQHEQEAHERG